MLLCCVLVERRIFYFFIFWRCNRWTCDLVTSVLKWCNITITVWFDRPEAPICCWEHVHFQELTNIPRHLVGNIPSGQTLTLPRARIERNQSAHKTCFVHIWNWKEPILLQNMFCPQLELKGTSLPTKHVLSTVRTDKNHAFHTHKNCTKRNWKEPSSPTKHALSEDSVYIKIKPSTPGFCL